MVEVDEQERLFPEALRDALAGRYAIGRELGRGGMATVFLARDERHGRSVALKLLRPAPALLADGGRSRVARLFEREIEFAASMSHPHILPLYDSGSAEGLLYYITPYVDGESLRARLLREGRLPLSECLSVLRDVAGALSYAHRQGLVHRDIKPANILLTRDGDALVADFGVAKGLAAAQGNEGSRKDLPEEGFVFGTPAYMAPEQVTGGEIDHRADLYALGVVAYELLTGTVPFAGHSRNEQLEAHVSQLPDPVAAREPGVPEALAALVNRLLSKRPEDRPRAATEVLEVLDAVMAGSVSQPRGTGAAAGTSERSIAVGADATRTGTEDREAYELYLKGRYLTNMRQPEGLFRALEYFEGAIARDPAYARAWAGIGNVWTFLGIYGQVPPNDAFPRGRAAAERATALDASLVEGHATLAHLLFVYDWNWRGAQAAFEQVIATGSPYPRLRMYYASFLHSVGRPEEALEQLAISKELDPLGAVGLLSGRVYVDTHRPDEAIHVLRQEIDLDPGLDLAHQLLAHAYLQKGAGDDAIASMRRAAALSGPRDLVQLGYIYARTGNEAEARSALSGVLGSSEQPLELLGFHLAMAFAGLGDSDEAFRWLEAAFVQRASFMNLLGVAAGFESVRGDPRFEDILRRMGLR